MKNNGSFLSLSKAISPIADLVLGNPWVFEMQQSVCNNYDNILIEFGPELRVKGKNILDVGCSTGACTRSIINMAENTFVGIDISDKYVAIAKKHNPLGHYEAMDGRKLTFAPKSMDLVLFFSVFHHMDDETVIGCLEAAAKVLKPDGKIIVAEPIFMKDRRVSTFFLNLDRGKFIRSQLGYKDLIENQFPVSRESYFDQGMHRFCSFVLENRRPA